MADTRQTDEHARSTDHRPALGRRRLLAGAAALVAARIAQQAAAPAAAANGESLILGNSVTAPGYQSASATTWLAATVAGGPGLRVSNAFPNVPEASADGVQGYADGAARVGVRGRNDAANGYGLRGDAPSGIGVVGVSGNAQGVYGLATNNAGVYGQSANSYGVYGVVAGGTGGAAVAGRAENANATAIVGTAAGNGGVAAAFTGPVNITGPVAVGGQMAAQSTTTHSIVGTSGVANAGGVLGQVGVNGGFGIYGYTANAAAYAGYFTGRVVVNGDFAVTGAKSAAIRRADGTHRLVYSVEAPEAWLEDFGEGTLANGKAAVALDPAFLALVDPASLHVFLTAHTAEGNGLAVTTRHATGFVVTERNKGTSGGTFSYRAVAKRRDNPGARLAQVDLPTQPLPPPGPPTLAAVPPPPPVTPVAPPAPPRKRTEG